MARLLKYSKINILNQVNTIKYACAALKRLERRENFMWSVFWQNILCGHCIFGILFEVVSKPLAKNAIWSKT